MQAPFSYPKEVIVNISGFDAEDSARELGAGGVDNIVTNAERICAYEAQRIELTNASVIVGLHAQYQLLADEERRLEERLRTAPPPGDLRRFRRRAIYYWFLTILLTIAGFAFALLSFAPFRLGWKAWLYCGGIAAVTPFLVEKLLEGPRMERLVKMLTVSATVAALVGLMLLAVIRGNLLAEQFRSQNAPAVVLDDSAPQPQPAQNDFYDSTLALLRLTLLFLSFAMELGAGLALHAAWLAAPDGSEDWDKLRTSLAQVRRGMAEIARQATMLRNEPAIFSSRFWRDFYRGLVTNAARSAMSKLLLYILMAGCFCLGTVRAQASDRLNLVVVIDLTQSVAVTGPDTKNEFQKNIDGVTRLLAQVPAGARVTVLGITDRSFTEPYILLRARVPDDPGYFGERLNAARGELVAAWKARSARFDPRFPKTDIFGALLLAGQLFADGQEPAKKMLVIYSDMREDTSDLDLESARSVPPFGTLADRVGAIPDLSGVQTYVLGADGAGKSIAYWQSLAAFWQAYFRRTGADLREFSALRELPEGMEMPEEPVGR